MGQERRLLRASSNDDVVCQGDRKEGATAASMHMSRSGIKVATKLCPYVFKAMVVNPLLTYWCDIQTCHFCFHHSCSHFSQCPSFRYFQQPQPPPTSSNKHLARASSSECYAAAAVAAAAICCCRGG